MSDNFSRFFSSIKNPRDSLMNLATFRIVISHGEIFRHISRLSHFSKYSFFVKNDYADGRRVIFSAEFSIA